MRRSATPALRKVMLDHGQASGLQPAVQAWLGAGIACAVLVAWLFNDVQGQLTRLQGDSVTLRQQGQARPLRQAPAELARQQDEARAVGAVLAELAQPWDALFAMLESLASPQVRLMQIDPNTRQHRLRLSAQATDAASMLAYIHALGQQSPLSEVLLLSHEHAEDGRSMPYRFVIEATWRN